jgi:hypothetical protein
MFTAEEMIRRLKPLLGPQADAMWESYLAADPEERKIMERSLENLHSHIVDDYNNERILLTPPSRLEELYGEYPAGMVWYADKPLYPFAFEECELNQHIGVFGRTGAGKSFFVRHLLSHILPRKPVMVFDWKGTYSYLQNSNVHFFHPGSSSHPFTFNPLHLDGIPEERRATYLRQVIDLFLDSYLGDLKLLTVHGVEYLLLLCIDDLLTRKGCITFKDISNWIKRFKGTFREKDWKISAQNLLFKLTTGPLGKVMHGPGMDIAWLVRQRAVFELNNIGSAKDKSFFIRTFLLRLYEHFQQQGTSKRMKLFIVLEEAHNLLLRKGTGFESIIELLLRQIREFGVGVCIVDQHPSLMSLPALGTYCTVAFNLRLKDDRDAMASALTLEESAYLGRLPPRFAIVKIQDRFLTPFLIRTFDVPKTQPSLLLASPDQGRLTFETPPKSKEVIRVIREEKKVIRGFSEVVRPESDVVRVIRRATNSRKKPLFWEEVFLIHCYIYPLMGTVKRYRQLGLIDYQGNKHKTSLVDKGLIAMEPVSTKGGRKKLMVPTRDGFAWLKGREFSTSSDKEGSIEHNYWKRRLSAQFERVEYDVSPEVSLGHNRSVDLLVSSDGGQVCIEVETGKNSKEQMQANIAKGVEHVGAVVLLLLHGKKMEVTGNPRVAVVGNEHECLEAVRRFLGDEK